MGDKTLEGNKTYFGSPAIDARDKWKEKVYVRMLPKIWNKLMFKTDSSLEDSDNNIEDELLA